MARADTGPGLLASRGGGEGAADRSHVGVRTGTRVLGHRRRLGLPVVRIGRQLRVPRHRLEDLAGGPISWPALASVRERSMSLPRPEQRGDQSTLPFSA